MPMLLKMTVYPVCILCQLDALAELKSVNTVGAELPSCTFHILWVHAQIDTNEHSLTMIGADFRKFSNVWLHWCQEVGIKTQISNSVFFKFLFIYCLILILRHDRGFLWNSKIGINFVTLKQSLWDVGGLQLQLECYMGKDGGGGVWKGEG